MAIRKDTSSPFKLFTTHVSIAFGILVVGTALIIWGAQGDLWLDEIWSLTLLEPVKSFSGIILDINHDNNNILNSMYLYAVGPDASSFVLRGLSIVFGVMTIVAVGTLRLRNSKAAALIAMFLFAISYPFIHYASEARGYAGVVLFSLLAIIILESEFERPRIFNRCALAVVFSLGLLSHLTMLLGVAAFGLWTFLILWRRTRDIRKTFLRGFGILFPGLCCAGLVVVGTLRVGLEHGFVSSWHSVPGKFAIGALGTLNYADSIQSYSKLLALIVGLPPAVSAWICLGGVSALIIFALYLWRDRDDPIHGLYFLSILVVPVSLIETRVPLDAPRYFLFSGTVFLLFIAEVISVAWQKAGPWRAIAVVMLIAISTGNASSLAHFFRDRRGHYSEALVEMAKKGKVIFSADSPGRTRMVVNYYSKKLGIKTRFIGTPSCASRPDWLIIEDPNDPILAHNPFTLTLPKCVMRFKKVHTYRYWGLSGRQWVIYHRVD